MLELRTGDRREVLESDLLAVVDSTVDLQVRQVAVTCLGHTARMFRASPRPRRCVCAGSRTTLTWAGACGALDDVAVFAT